MYNSNNYLIHHGVKGMKWGVRHDLKNTAKRLAWYKVSSTISKNREAKKTNKPPKHVVDVSKAKNSATKRVAEDYHKLSDREFKGKYKVNKEKFAKRYNKTKGDTYSSGLRKQRLAIAYLSRTKGYSWTKTAATIAKYEGSSRAEQKLLDNGKKKTSEILRVASAANMSEFNDTYYMPTRYRQKYGLQTRNKRVQ